VIDPLGGSWYVEWLTDEIERQAEEEFARILALSPEGTMTAGILRGIDEGYFTSAIADAAFDFQNRMDKGRFKQVGVNAYVDDDEDELEILRISAEVGRQQADRVAKVRASRDGHALEAALTRLTAAAATDENLVPLIMDAVRAEATVGEVSKALQSVWGTYHETPRL
jgi:methylmalonyl-CoA mutase, N-terminal domain